MRGSGMAHQAQTKSASNLKIGMLASPVRCAPDLSLRPQPGVTPSALATIRRSRCAGAQRTSGCHAAGSGKANTSRSANGSHVRSRINASRRAIVHCANGRCCTTMASPARMCPAAITRRYQPARSESCTRRAMSGTAKRSLSFQHGCRPWLTSTIVVPIRQRSPMQTLCSSRPSTLRFSPKAPACANRAWPGNSCNQV